MNCSDIPMPPNDYDERLSFEKLDEIFQKFPLLKDELNHLFQNYKIISISHTRELIFTIEFNCKVTNQKYVPKLIDYKQLK